MSYLNLVFVGNIGNIEMRFTPAGQAVTTMSVAVNRKYTKSDGQKVEEVTWLRVSAWGKLAETCNQFLKKGQQILVEGRLTPDENGNPRTFQRQDGTTGASFEVNADRVVFLGGKQQSGEEQPQESAPF